MSFEFHMAWRETRAAWRKKMIFAINEDCDSMDVPWRGL